MKNPFRIFSHTSLRALGTVFLAASLSTGQATATMQEESVELPHTTEQEEKIQRRHELEDMQQAVTFGNRAMGGPGYTAAYHIPATPTHPGVTFQLPAGFT